MNIKIKLSLLFVIVGFFLIDLKANYQNEASTQPVGFGRPAGRSLGSTLSHFHEQPPRDSTVFDTEQRPGSTNIDIDSLHREIRELRGVIRFLEREIDKLRASLPSLFEELIKKNFPAMKDDLFDSVQSMQQAFSFEVLDSLKTLFNRIESIENRKNNFYDFEEQAKSKAVTRPSSPIKTKRKKHHRNFAGGGASVITSDNDLDSNSTQRLGSPSSNNVSSDSDSDRSELLAELSE